MRHFDTAVVFSNSSVGDFLIALIFCDQLRQASGAKEAYIFVPKQAEQFSLLASSYPYVRVCLLNRSTMHANVRTLFTLARRRTLVVTFPTFGVLPWSIKVLARLLTLSHGSKYVGFLDKSVAPKIWMSRWRTFEPTKSIWENLIEVAGLAGVVLPPATPLFTPPPVAWDALVVRLSLPKSYTVVHMCASTLRRSLPPKRWAGILDTLAVDLSVLLTGTSADKLFINTVRAMMQRPDAIVDLTAQLSLVELSTVLTHAAVYVGVDTGVSHLAALLRVPSVVVGNRSNPSWLPAYNPNGVVLTNAEHCVCTGKKRGDCFVGIEGISYYRCLVEVTDEEILSAVTAKRKHR